MERHHDYVLHVADVGVQLSNEPEILSGVTFDLKRGEALAIIGPNGAGKSTLLKALLGLIPHTGIIKWSDNLKIGYIPQNIQFDRDVPLTANDFMNLRSKSLRKKIEALERVGVVAGEAGEHHIEEHFLNKPMSTLSGGEFQRVLIAWALMDKPDVLLIDESTSGIDIGGEETIYGLIRKIQRENNMTVILISHDLNVVYRYATTVICLNKKQICFGSPQVALDPKSLNNLYGIDADFYKHSH